MIPNYFILLMFISAIVLKIVYDHAIKKGVTEIDIISKPLFIIIDKILTTNEHHVKSFILNELKYFNSCANIILLKLYLESVFKGIPDKNIFNGNQHIYEKGKQFIEFASNTTPVFKTAIINMLAMQIKLKVIANYPDLATNIKEDLITLTDLLPTDKLELLSALYQIQTKCERYNLKYKTTNNVDPYELYNALLMELRNSYSCGVCYTMKSNVVSIKKK